MREVWLRGNTRPLWLVTLVAGFILLAGVALLINAWQRERGVVVAFVLFNSLITVLVVFRIWQRHGTRVAYENGQLQLRLAPSCQRVPVSEVECFLLGQSPSHLPGKQHRHTETRTLVVRLRDKHADWERRDLNPRLGTWCGHHITIRGTCCEPITIELVQRMNDRLVEVQRSQRVAP